MKDAKFSTSLLDIINTVRTDLDSAIPLLDEFKEYYLTYYPSKTKTIEQLNQIKKSLNSGETDDLSPIEENKTLNDIANFILADMASAPGKKFYPESDEFLSATLSFYFSDVMKCRNFVSTKEDPKDVLLDLLTNEKAIDIGHHLLLEPNINSIGISHDYFKEHVVTVVVISDSVTERSDESNLEEIFVNDLNNLRAYPKIALRLLPEDNQKTAELIEPKRPSPELTINERLCNAANDRITSIDKNTQPLRLRKLNNYLDQFGSGHLTAEEVIITDPIETSMDLIQAIITDENLIDKFFSRKMREIGFNFDKENEITLIYLANKFIEPVEEKEITVTSLQRRLVRPKLSEDELIQIENDFHKFDVLRKGKIIPKTVLIYMNKSKNFAELNPWYYQVFRNLNTEDNNKEGVDLDMFVEEVQKVICDCNRKFDENWGKIFDNVAGGENEIIGKKELTNLVRELGYEGNNEDITNLLDKLEGDLDKKKFLEVCKIIEYRFADFRKKQQTKTTTKVLKEEEINI